jgi:membrane fusion protein, multidrug efflux system
MRWRVWAGSLLLLLAVLGVAAALAVWKRASMKASDAAAGMQHEPMDAVAVATARSHEHRAMTTSIGTVVALRSVRLRNEVAGTVREVNLAPGRIVEEGVVLVQLDVSVEEAELKAQQAQAALTETLLERTKQAGETRAASEVDVERARAERDVALAQVARTRAIIARKTIKAPFAARVGMSDVHPGQYLNEGTALTTLQGVDDAAHVDFPVAQRVAAVLKEGESVEVLPAGGEPTSARIVAVDARVDPETRNAMVRARVDGARKVPAPGAAVRVRVPVGPSTAAIAVPVSALRRGPGGDHVFVIGPAKDGKTRAQMRTVRPGPMLGDEVLIHDGLAAGEQVAASGSFKLRDDGLVAIVEGGR